MKAILLFGFLVSFIFCDCTTMTYPLFKQCDSKWGSDQLGTSSNTICTAGCLMSSVSMALNGRGKKISGQDSDPATLNTWLTNNGGYAEGDLFVWASVEPFGFDYVGQPSQQSEIVNYVCSNNKYIAILNVRDGGHWVLATGVNQYGYTVNDPGFTDLQYNFTQVVLAGIFST